MGCINARLCLLSASGLLEIRSGFIYLEAKSTPRWNWNHVCNVGAPAVWSQSLIIEHTCLCSYQCDSRGATAAAGFTCWHNLHDKWSLKYPQVCPVCDSSEQVQKENSGESNELILQRWSLVKRGTCVTQQIKVNLSTANECPFGRATQLRQWDFDSVLLEDSEVFTKEQRGVHRASEPPASSK